MSHARPSVLVVDDEPNILRTLGIAFESIGFETHLYGNPRQVLDLIPTQPFDLAFLDLKMSPLSGIELMERIKQAHPTTTVVIITAHGSVDTAIDAVRKGAYDYLQKPFDMKELQLFTQRAWEHHKLTQEISQLRKLLAQQPVVGDIVTRSAQLLEQLDLATRVAASDIPVLLEGESGTGKELVAKLIHEQSGRSTKPFVKINCAALPAELLESELFGHVRGAFTGAVKDRQGRFEVADGGSVFLDEVTELPLMLQPKLLRVLQNKEYERIGESVPRAVDVRVIAATNKDIDQSLAEGTFREDLFYRLNGMRLRIAPLRERPADIPLLVQHFLQKFSKGEVLTVSPEAMKALQAYRWNGNVRELENAVQRAVILATGESISIKELPEEIRSSVGQQDQPLSLEEVEKVHIKKVLQQSHDLEEAARLLGIDPATLWRKRKKYRL